MIFNMVGKGGGGGGGGNLPLNALVKTFEATATGNNKTFSLIIDFKTLGTFYLVCESYGIASDNTVAFIYPTVTANDVKHYTSNGTMTYELLAPTSSGATTYYQVIKCNVTALNYANICRLNITQQSGINANTVCKGIFTVLSDLTTFDYTVNASIG